MGSSWSNGGSCPPVTGPTQASLDAAEARIKSLEDDLERQVKAARTCGTDLQQTQVRVTDLLGQVDQATQARNGALQAQTQLTSRLADMTKARDLAVAEQAATAGRLADMTRARDAAAQGTTTNQTDCVRAQQSLQARLEAATRARDVATTALQECAARRDSLMSALADRTATGASRGGGAGQCATALAFERATPLLLGMLLASTGDFKLLLCPRDEPGRVWGLPKDAAANVVQLVDRTGRSELAADILGLILEAVDSPVGPVFTLTGHRADPASPRAPTVPLGYVGVDVARGVVVVDPTLPRGSGVPAPYRWRLSMEDPVGPDRPRFALWNLAGMQGEWPTLAVVRDPTTRGLAVRRLTGNQSEALQWSLDYSVDRSSSIWSSLETAKPTGPR